MAYSVRETLRLLQLKKKLGSNSPYDCTYRDVPVLNKIAETVSRHEEEDAAGDTAAMLLFIAQCFDSIGRLGISAGYYKKYIACLCRLPVNEELKEQLDDAVYETAKLLNSYKGISDDCGDIIALTAPILGEDESRCTAEKGKAAAHVKYDPVENTSEYLAVIDEVEKRIDKELGTDMYRGKCHEIWALQRELLEKKGIVWRSPASLNPRIRFD